MLALVLSCLAAAGDAAAPAAKPLLMVLPIKAAAPDLAGSSAAVDELVLEAVTAAGTYQALGPADLNALLGAEKMKDAAGCTDVSCAAELGGALGAPFYLAGELNKLGQKVLLSLRLIDTREAKVVARASASGSADARELEAMARQAVATLLGPPRTGAVLAADTYAAYTAAMTALGKLVAAAEYTKVLALVDDYQKKPFDAPPGQDAREMLAYYQVFACSMLKREECVRTRAADYRQRWPDGMWKTAVESFVRQLEDLELERTTAQAKLGEQLAEIDTQAQQHHLPEAQVVERRAWAYFAAKRFVESAAQFARLRALTAADEEAWFKATESYVLACEQAGRFDDGRAALLEARARNETRFRLQHLRDTLERLPK